MEDTAHLVCFAPNPQGVPHRDFSHAVADSRLRLDAETVSHDTRIENGEYELPLYADLTSMPELERKAIWGLMIGEETKTNIKVDSNE